MQFNDGQSEYSDAKSVSKTGSEKKEKKKNKSESKTKNQSQTINVTNRQMAKQCIGKKSNFLKSDSKVLFQINLSRAYLLVVGLESSSNG